MQSSSSPSHVNANATPAVQQLALQQTKHVQNAAALTRAVILDGKPITISEFSDELQSTLQDSVGRVVEVSKQAIVMLYELQNMQRDIEKMAHACKESVSLAQAMCEVGENLAIVTSSRKRNKEQLETLKAELKSAQAKQQEICSAVTDVAGRCLHKVQTLEGALAEVAGADITKNLATSERLNAMLKGFEDQQTKLYTSLMDAMRVGKAISNVSH